MPRLLVGYVLTALRIDMEPTPRQPDAAIICHLPSPQRRQRLGHDRLQDHASKCLPLPRTQRLDFLIAVKGNLDRSVVVLNHVADPLGVGQFDRALVQQFFEVVLDLGRLLADQRG
jgi:hypothetical protein